MKEISDERKRMILREKIAVWENTLYGAKVDYETWKVLKDEQRMKRAEMNVRNALGAIAYLNGELGKVGKAVGGGEGA